MSGSNHRRALPPLIAHRGASHAAPENTLPAFALAWAEGADGIEADFHLSADGHIICMHDSSAARTCGADLHIREQSLAVLQKCDAGGGAPPPTLEDILAILPRGKALEIEIKCGAEMLPPLAALLAQQPADLRLSIISFSPQVIAASKRHLPHLPAMWLAAFNGESDDPPAKEILATLRQCGADGLGSTPQTPAETTAQVLAQGYHWHIWTVDDAASANRALRQGATSITTNTPAKLREALCAEPAER